MSLGILKGKTGSYLQNSQATIAKFSPKVDVFRNNIASNCRDVVTQDSDDYSFSNLRLINHE